MSDEQKNDRASSEVDAAEIHSERMQKQARAALADAQSLIEREHRRLAEILEVKIDVPAPAPFELGDGMEAINRILQSTNEYLEKQLKIKPPEPIPSVMPYPIPSSIQESPKT